MTNQLAFHNTQFNIVTHNNKIWLTAKELAKALNYKNTKSIANLYNENEDEFTIGMSLVIDSVTNGINGSSRRLKMRVFSLRGAHLIAMFARTPVAKEFRRWVLDILDRETGEVTTHPIEPTEEIYTLNLTRSELCSLCWGWNAGDHMREELERLYPGLIALRSPLADSVGTMASHYQRTLEATKIILERETRHIEPKPYSAVDANWRTVLTRLRKTATSC